MCAQAYTHSLYTNTYMAHKHDNEEEEKLCVVGLGRAVFELELDLENFCNNRN